MALNSSNPYTRFNFTSPYETPPSLVEGDPAYTAPSTSPVPTNPQQAPGAVPTTTGTEPLSPELDFYTDETLIPIDPRPDLPPGARPTYIYGPQNKKPLEKLQSDLFEDVEIPQRRGKFEASPDQLALRKERANLIQRKKALETTLENIASGKTPSLAELQFSKAKDQMLMNTLTGIASSRGVSPEAILRQQIMARQEANRGLAKEKAILGLEERERARRDLASVQQQTAEQMASLGYELESDRAARLNRAQVMSAEDIAGQQLAQRAKESDEARFDKYLSTGASLAALAALMPSDKNKKENVKDGTKDVREMFEKLSAKKYNYKNEKDGKGDFLGIMAQDLEKSDSGKDIVKNTKDGKQIDLQKAITAMLASNADIHKRLEKLEKRG